MKRAVAALINNEGKILLGKKREDSSGWFAGKWHIPGETLEDRETEEEALIRGIREEAGIEIKVIRYLTQHTFPKGTNVNWYECEALTNKIYPSSDLEKVEWVPMSEVPRYCGEVSILWPKEIKEYFGLDK